MITNVEFSRRYNTTNKLVKQMSLGLLVWLHLFPGLLIALAYALLVGPITGLGYPKLLALGVAATAILIPVELGIMFYFSKKEHGLYSLAAVVGYRDRLSLKNYLVWVPTLFVWAGMAFTLTKVISDYLQNTFFSWVPSWYLINDNLVGYPKGALVVTFLSCLVLTGLMAPIVEELYFRGFLLPRMTWMGKAAPFVNTLLFALYHFWTPWQVVTRVLALVPTVYIVNAKRNIYIGIMVHCLMNIVGDALGVLLLVLK